MSADNRGGGVTYRERKRKKEGRRPAFFLGLLFFCLRGTGGGVTYREGKGRTETGFLFGFAFFSLARDGWWWLSGSSFVGWLLGTTRQLWNLLGWTGRGGDGLGGGGRLFNFLFIINNVKCMAGYCVLFSSSFSFFLALAPLHPRYLSGRY
jgi:hypothetical protein